MHTWARRKCTYFLGFGIITSIISSLMIINYSKVSLKRSGFFLPYVNLEKIQHIDRKLTATVGPVQVLLLTYMRSGSSLTGEILGEANEAFYVFEPLRMFYNSMHVNSTQVGKVTSGNTSVKNTSLSIIRSWLNCDIENMADKYYLIEPFLAFGHKTSQFTKCMNQRKSKGVSRLYKIKTCKYLLKRLCRESPVRIIKTIRMAMADIRDLMEELPNLHVVHLVRDPRGTLNSQRKFGMCRLSHGGWLGCTNTLCLHLEHDLIAGTKLLQDYPGRVMSVQYRDLALSPLITSRKLFEFLGLGFTKEIEDFVRNKTMSKEVEGKWRPMSTSRSNSSKLIDSWKAELPKASVRIIEDRCNYVLRHYGFLK